MPETAIQFLERWRQAHVYAHSALERLRHKKYELVLSDWEMHPRIPWGDEARQSDWKNPNYLDYWHGRKGYGMACWRGYPSP